MMTYLAQTMKMAMVTILYKVTSHDVSFVELYLCKKKRLHSLAPFHILTFAVVLVVISFNIHFTVAPLILT